MRIVVDVGCARYGGDYSIERLVEEFHPDYLYGFDPGAAAGLDGWLADGTKIYVRRKAAWTSDGELGYFSPGLGGYVADEPGGVRVPCVDLAEFIRQLPPGEIILKIDAEGAEYRLLEHLIAQGVDARLKLVWVEWHPPRHVATVLAKRRRKIEREISCEIAEWRW